jgi:signal transduction histidine kinase
MARRPLIVVSGLLVAALALLVVIGLRVLERDRDRLFSQYAHEREQAVAETARGLTDDLADIGEDLELASALLQGASSPQFAERELHAIATIKREYLAMYARTDSGDTTIVNAYDAPSNVATLANESLSNLTEQAARAPGKLLVSRAFAGSEVSSWYRVFARRPKEHGPSVAVVVDMAVLLARIKLHDPLTRAMVVDAAGHVQGDRALRAFSLVAANRSVIVDAEAARQIGLPATRAVAVSVPLSVDPGPAWHLVVVTSAQQLQTREKTIVRRVLVGGALVLVLMLSATAYVLHSTFRARSLREQLKHTEHLAHSEKLITAGQLAAGIAHEIGTPLNVARGRVELALSHLGTAHAEADNHRVAIDQIDRVTRLIQQLLDYVRPTPAAVQSVDLARTLHVVQDLLAPQAAKRKVTLRIHTPPETPILRADPDQMQQIIVNLTLNAIDACDKGGSVSLGAAKRDGAVVLEVVDDGAGIAPELQKQVFDPFFTTKKRGQGTGLGLWVVAQLVRAQSAEIELDSKPGRGTTVRVLWQERS